MEKFKLSLVNGRSFKRGAELGTAMLVGSGLSALGGLGSGFLGSAAARSNNEQTMAFNREMQQRSFDYQTQMYERQLKDQENLYNKYQSPQAIAEQLKAIGLNTSVLAGKGFSSGSMPSVPSPASVSVPQISGLENQGFYFDKALDTTTKAISNLSQASFNDARTEATRAKLEYEVEKLIAEKDGQDLLNAYQATQNVLQAEFGREKIGAELKEIHSRIVANYCRGEYDLAAKDCQDAMTMLYQQQHKMNDEKFGQIMMNMYAEWQLTQAKIQTERSVQALNKAYAFESSTRAVGLEFDNIVKNIDSENAAASAVYKLDALRSAYLKDKAVSDSQRVKANIEFEKLDKILRSYIEHPNKAALDATLDNFNEHFPVLGGFFKALSK